MSLDLDENIRSVYNISDLASDLGGLYGAVFAIFGGLLFVMNFWGSYQYVMDELFVGPRVSSSDHG